MVRAHNCETLGWDDKLTIIFNLYNSLRYWTHDLSTSLMNTPTGDFLDQLAEHSEETTQTILGLKRRGKLSQILVEENAERMGL